ncbi:MAG: HipA domain-containing protein [Actinobacteria bacterium]|nr:HipA domain-containing protein [Actinomycetota bacterium]
MRLAIELYGQRIGALEGDARTFDVTVVAEAIEHFGMNSTVLSVAIPLSPHLRRDHASRRRNWFAELLPEGDQYEFMLAQSGLRAGDTLGFLAHYGRDIAGAVQLWNLDDPTEPRTPELRAVNDVQIRELLTSPMMTPLANAPREGRTSLGGVQPKIVLVRTTTGWAQALGGWPSTHILKPELQDVRAHIIYDEEYGSRLAREVGLAAFDTRIETFDGQRALVIERFDRADGVRIHQEDFSQALGASRIEKYQEFGGVTSLARIARVLATHTSVSELRRFARMVVFGMVINNLDMHAKNIGLLHQESGEVTLAPAYDNVPFVRGEAGGSDGRLALAVNGSYESDTVTRGDLVAEISSWGVSRVEPLVDDMLDSVRAAVESQSPGQDAHPQMLDTIGYRLRQLTR